MLLLSWGALKDTLSIFFLLLPPLSFIFVLFFYPHDFAVLLFKAAFECGRKECLFGSSATSLHPSLPLSFPISFHPFILPPFFPLLSLLWSVVVGMTICCLQSRCDRLRVVGGLSLSLSLLQLNLEGLFERLQGFGGDGDWRIICCWFGWWRLRRLCTSLLFLLLLFFRLGIVSRQRQGLLCCWGV